MDKPKKIYVSGPITGMINKNAELFESTTQKLRDLDYDVINPLELDEPNKDTELTYEDYLARDLVELVGCSALCLLPGWEHSYGARIELAVANALNMPVFRFEGEDLIVEEYANAQVVCETLFPSTFWK